MKRARRRGCSTLALRSAAERWSPLFWRRKSWSSVLAAFDLYSLCTVFQLQDLTEEKHQGGGCCHFCHERVLGYEVYLHRRSSHDFIFSGGTSEDHRAEWRPRNHLLSSTRGYWSKQQQHQVWSKQKFNSLNVEGSDGDVRNHFSSFALGCWSANCLHFDCSDCMKFTF